RLAGAAPASDAALRPAPTAAAPPTAFRKSRRVISSVMVICLSQCSGTAAQKPNLSPHALECRHGAVQVLPLQRRRHLDADPGGALRYHGKAEAGDEDAFFEQPLADPDGECGVPHDDRNDGCIP